MSQDDIKLHALREAVKIQQALNHAIRDLFAAHGVAANSIRLQDKLAVETLVQNLGHPLWHEIPMPRDSEMVQNIIDQ